jgi:isopenicillin-N epimerase
VTSPTGLVFPIERIVRELDARGIDTLVDGAHAPGMVELSIEKIGAAYYTANFHKWPCAPKGAAMLWIRADKQEPIVPPVISHGFRSSRPKKRLLEQFDWTGTDDPTPWLCMPIALDHVASLGGGWPAVRAHNRALVLCARAILCDALGIDPPAPEGMIGALAALPIPPGKAEAGSAPESNPLQHHLFAAHRIEVPVMQWPSAPGRLIRVSAHLHNVEDDYRTLAQALGSALA